MRAAPIALVAAAFMAATTACARSAEGEAASQASAAAPDAALQAAIASDARPAADRARDVYRHPYESLTFWGLTPGSTVVEIQPGAAGWWSNILRPYADATGGRWVGINRLADFEAVADGSADMVLVARAFHNWHRGGRTDAMMETFFKILKPGGVLAVEQHRAAEGSDPDATAPFGYVSEAYVIAAAERAGFVLDGRSEINANPRDDRDHPYGVWTLPPTRNSAPRDGVATDRPTPLTEAERAEYDAVGESDRMTLRFRKPA
ncbi:methyltransferase [Brevundimonas sp. 2R-24]|uniref:Methyltransferase n=1 Tax=Peiella sedimenti TaxID=3061083 RepID=A0ABT8SNN0_9CAUL|nr:methyltransferase [Caulobacteraceae bacterium XZ-24]